MVSPTHETLDFRYLQQMVQNQLLWNKILQKQLNNVPLESSEDL